MDSQMVKGWDFRVTFLLFADDVILLLTPGLQLSLEQFADECESAKI